MIGKALYHAGLFLFDKKTECNFRYLSLPKSPHIIVMWLQSRHMDV